ncbi:MAG TPA: GGDEF domain-containing protein, partial [Candidatus Izemoplasmatales bacterium]|nr:GGDEF domain-containing protein [Candidatus Izemoplasmatales bacterium]
MKTNCNIGYVNTLLQKAKEAEHRSTERALDLSKEALSLAQEYQYRLQEGRAYVRMGRCYWINGAFDEAINCLNNGLSIADEVNDRPTYAEALNGRGNVFITMELFDQASVDYHNALNFSKEHGLSKQESKLNNNLGTLHEELKNYSQALKFYKQSLALAESVNDDYGIAIAYLNMGNVYLGLNDLKQSEPCINRALDYAKVEHKTLFLAHGYDSLGRLYYQKSDYKKSLEYYKIAVKKAEKSKDLNILVKIYIDLAKSYHKVNDFEHTEQCYQMALKLTKRIGVDEFMPRVHEDMAAFYEENNLFDKAFEHYKAYHNFSNTIKENRLRERIKSIDIQSELKASQAETESYRRLSKKLETSYQQMYILSKIGQSMTSTHKLHEIFEQLYDQVNKLMKVQSLGVALYDSQMHQLKFDLLVEKGEKQDYFSLSLDNKKSWAVWSFLNRKTLCINDAENEYKKYIEDVASSRGELMNSVMYAPLMVEGEPLGILTIQNKEKNSYTPQDEVLLETLASYLAIAIKNAKRSKELAKLNSKLKSLSELDGLTGIPNRRLFDARFDQLWREMEVDNDCLSLIMLDIDYFKNFNDSYGHLMGDDVVVKVAKHLESLKRDENDFVARFGGDEFIILLPRCNEGKVMSYAERLKASLIDLNNDFDVNDQVTLSIGIAVTYPNQDKTKETFLETADHQLYISKENGKNCISKII